MHSKNKKSLQICKESYNFYEGIPHIISIDELKRKAESQGAALTIHECGSINAIYPSGNFISTANTNRFQENINLVYDFLERVTE